MTDDDKKELLKSKGWSTWYNSNYWVHEKVVDNNYMLDYTNYGMNLQDAYLFEVENKKPFKGGFLSWMGGVRWS